VPAATAKNAGCKWSCLARNVNRVHLCFGDELDVLVAAMWAENGSAHKSRWYVVTMTMECNSGRDTVFTRK